MRWLSLLLTLTLSVAAFAAKTKTGGGGGSGKSPALNPEALGAKAFLEDVLVRRYSQELTTKVDQKSFSMGAQLELSEISPVVKPVPSGEIEPISDLMIGSLDPEELIKKYAGADERASVQGFLKNYKIKSVGVSVGLKDDVPPEMKGEVEKWLTARLAKEFGSAGKGEVSVIKTAQPKGTVDPSFLDFLNRFQSLAGQFVLALALLVGILLWRVSSKPAKTAAAGEGMAINVNTPKAEAADPEKQLKLQQLEEQERASLESEVESLTRRLNDLVPRMSTAFEPIIRSWCQAGEEGRMKLACFAEAVGKEVGKLPIPVDALSDVSKVFAKMSYVSLTQKRGSLQKAYWDLLTALNIGAEALYQPFGYLSGLNVSSINEVLIDQNPKMKTLVSLFLPDELRAKFIKGMSVDAKREVLESASNLNSIPSDELKTFDVEIMKRISPDLSKDFVPLEMTLQKIISGLNMIEEMTLLHELAGGPIGEFKKTVPSIAFLGEWPDSKLKILMTRLTSDELVAILRVRPDLTERLMKASPPLTAEVATDDLSRPDTISEGEKIQILTFVDQKLKEMIRNKELILDEIFVSDPTALLEELFGDKAA